MGEVRHVVEFQATERTGRLDVLGETGGELLGDLEGGVTAEALPSILAQGLAEAAVAELVANGFRGLVGEADLYAVAFSVLSVTVISPNTNSVVTLLAKACAFSSCCSACLMFRVVVA